MLFSVITPTLNQAQFVEKTIQSVLGQNYPDFEHVVIDGGSTDGTIEILKKYPRLKWTSEKDQGRGDALNKGFRAAQGDIIAWINSDDYYLPEVFSKLAFFFEQNSGADVVVGRARVVDAKGNFLFDQDDYPSDQLHFQGLLRFWKHATLPQPSLFFKRKILEDVGFFDEKLHDYPDYDLVLRLSQKHRIFKTQDFYSAICIQENAGSVIDLKHGILEEKLFKVSRPYWSKLSLVDRMLLRIEYAVAYPWICLRSRYESFALSHKQQLKKSWQDKSSVRYFLNENRDIWRRYPLESVCACFHFLFKK